MFVQQQVEKLAMTAIEFPPMQKGASFNLDAVKAKIEAATSARWQQVNRRSATDSGGRLASAGRPPGVAREIILKDADMTTKLRHPATQTACILRSTHSLALLGY